MHKPSLLILAIRRSFLFAKSKANHLLSNAILALIDPKAEVYTGKLFLIHMFMCVVYLMDNFMALQMVEYHYNKSILAHHMHIFANTISQSQQYISFFLHHNILYLQCTDICSLLVSII